MTKLLTRRKQAWQQQFKPQILRGGALNPSIAAELRYYNALAKLIVRMSEETLEALQKFFDKPHAEEYFAQDDTIAAQARILTNALTRKFDDLFSAAAKPLAEKTVDDASASSKSSLHLSLKDLSGGLSLKTDIFTPDVQEILSASITENVGLIKSISAQYLQGVHGAVMRSITTGNGLQDLVPYLKSHEGVTLRRARIIAEDQTRKAFNNLNKARMLSIGVKEFEWLHSGGSLHPRPLHIAYNGKIFDLLNPPVIDPKTGVRGIPGQLINCKCRMRPVISFSGNAK